MKFEFLQENIFIRAIVKSGFSGTGIHYRSYVVLRKEFIKQLMYLPTETIQGKILGGINEQR